MFEPDFLTVAELADRWQQTQLQILGHANALRVPLYFAFDGLAFDVGDRWHRHGGDCQKAQKCDFLDERISSMEAHLLRNARGQTGKFDKLDSHEAKEMRTRIDECKKERRLFAGLLEQRERERHQCEYRGYMRASPLTLWEITSNGSAEYPTHAYHPASPVCITTLDDGSFVQDGRIMALEALPGYASYQKETLDAGDLVASLAEVKAVEAAHSGMPAIAVLPSFRPRIGWQISLFDAWPAMRKLYGRDPSATEAIQYLKNNDTSGNILNKGGNSELWWKTNRSNQKEVQFKTVETCISGWRTRGQLPA